MQNFCNNTFSSQKLKCRQPNHTDQKLKFLCLNPSCTKEKRLLCDYCIQDHQHNEYLIKIKDLENKLPDQIHNWPITKNKHLFQPYLKQLVHQDPNQDAIRYFYDNNKTQVLYQNAGNVEKKDQIDLKNKINQQKSFMFSCKWEHSNYIEETFLKFQEIFENLKENITKKLQEMEKQIQMQIQCHLVNIEDLEFEIRDKLHSIFNVIELKNMFYKNNTEEDLEKLRNQIDEKYGNNSYQQQEEQCVKIIEKINLEKKQNDKIFAKINKIEKKIIDDFKDISDKLKIETFLLDLPQQNNFMKFVQSKYGSSQKNVKISSKMIQFLPDQNWKMVYSEPFNKNENINLKFKLSGKDIFNSFFTIGVVTQDDIEINQQNSFAQTGTQFALSPYKIHSKPNEQTGVRFYDTYYEGIDCHLDINIGKNQLEFYDKNKKSHIKNTGEFENCEKWRILISAYGPVAPTIILI
ncbi:hypothetical protein PPERSA_09182 [Pseudocohnilembus persalinus]|uniref:Uncharacterized protein n=1 Tax=Pseudocohnilembus persalinus TaxID=266149 RepID=A0A0V0QWN7_PSEPJ|nr:hypothetical protein PPERSA_09182 [Pseudocohnilembus persalinus]|eukprot:KRX06780.1 hypothetical protein PPERSA_09182 [Pseudocohnilembus persalinus]